ncbi:hypothetical protein PBI_OMNICRON_60 [Mycobacterium phage Omnicron]|uniref:Uncharacterized protein n=1 Tax=Mycobacterium phage Omnicron TaxID=1541819 RepID=A0A088FQG7_9CAUD|nr:hypothetical protein PBI_OMNICRON_60 [Mycobacterium phage Omnicron]AIM50393.1 hypothetical protein PBI_OMNICRON_60 [Mycobacterium phage Omnicron]
MTAPKPRIRQASSLAKGEWGRAAREGRPPRRNWTVEYGALRLAYSTRIDALNAGVALRLWGMILPLGLVGMHREVES